MKPSLPLCAVADLKSFLRGGWRLDRSFFDFRQAIAGQMLGEAHFAAAESALLYREHGTLTFGAHRGSAEQAYRFEFPTGNGRAAVHFQDGRAFHELDLSEGETSVSHECGRDLYEGRFAALDDERWHSAWTITGRRKDLSIVTLYTRMG